VTGERVELSGDYDDIEFYDSSNVLQGIIDTSTDPIESFRIVGAKNNGFIVMITKDAGGSLAGGLFVHHDYVAISSDVLSFVDGIYDLGSSAYRWDNLFLSGFMNLGNMPGAYAATLTPTNGSMYCRTDDDVVRVYLNGNWQTLAIVQ
jgi:hypothetical protein